MALKDTGRLRRLLLPLWAALVFAAAPALFGFSLDSSAVTRSLDQTNAPVNSSIVVTAIFTNANTATLRGFYYVDQLPSALSVNTLAVTLNGQNLTNYVVESGQDGDVYAGMTPWRWLLESPTNFPELNPLPGGGVVQVKYALSSSAAGAFDLSNFAWVAFNPITTNQLFGFSEPADARTIRFMSSTSNNPPQLPSQPDRIVDELTPLVVTNRATDPDQPAQPLIYTLLNPPAGAQIDTNGVITWTPSETQGPGTKVITTVVTDVPDGMPGLSATNTFRVIVNEINSAPVLPAQVDVTISPLSFLSLNNTATDSDIPANTLTYQLAQAPAGAAINASGSISWVPTMAQAGTTNRLQTVVTDYNPWANTALHLSSSNSFLVYVLPTPIEVPKPSLNISNQQATLRWNSIPGKTYRVQYTIDWLRWNNLLPDIQATGATAAATLPISDPAPRYFRVLPLALQP